MKNNQDIVLTTKQMTEAGLGQWHVQITGKTWSNLIDAARKQVVDQLQIPGFRKGKVPPHLASKHITETAILKQAGNKAPKVAYDYAINQKDLAVKATNQPEVNIPKISLTECELIFNFDLPLEVKIKKLSGFDIPKSEVKVSKTDIEHQIKLLKDRFAVYSTKEKGTVAVGDVAVFDFKGTIDGKEFDGNQGKDTNLEIGSQNFIPGFEDQLVGMKPNSEKVIKVTFPKNYHVASLIDKEAEFHINLKEIKNKIVSDNLDELVQDLNLPEVKTGEDLTKFIEKQLLVEKNRTVRDEFLNAYIEAVTKQSTLIFPHSVIEKETDRLINEFKKQLTQQNVDINEYKKITGLSDQDISREATKDAIWQLQSYVISEEIIKDQKIAATDAEIDQYLEALSQQTKMPVTELKVKMPDLTYIKGGIARQKALDWIWENNGPKLDTPKSDKATTSEKASA